MWQNYQEEHNFPKWQTPNYLWTEFKSLKFWRKTAWEERTRVKTQRGYIKYTKFKKSLYSYISWANWTVKSTDAQFLEEEEKSSYLKYC